MRGLIIQNESEGEKERRKRGNDMEREKWEG